jgi:Tfp pilus assembly protein PilF
LLAILLAAGSTAEIACDIDLSVVYRMSLADVQTIQAVGSLWKLAAVVLIIISLTLFQKQIRKILDRLSHFRFNWGKAAFSINEPALEERVKAVVEKQEIAGVEKPATTEPESAKAAEGPPESNWEFEMIRGFMDEDRGKAKEAFEKLQAAEKDESKRIENEAGFLYWSFQSGDVSAQAKLQRLDAAASEFPDTQALVRQWDAWCYKFANDNKRAERRFLDAAAVAHSPKLRAQNLRFAAQTMAECGSRTEAEDLLISRFAKAADNEERGELLLALADLYEPESMEKRALMLERVLSYQPVDKQKQFAAGYAYSDAGMNGLAAVHYEKCLDIGPRQEMAKNNLGVALKALKLPSLAVAEYKTSMDLGGTLAAANLAWVLMDAGALEEAETILRTARGKENVHQNVFAALNRLEKIREEEKKRKQKIAEVSEKRRQFLLGYADAMLMEGEWKLPEGQWTRTSGKDGSVSIPERSKLEATWRVEKGKGLFGELEQYRFKGELQGRVARGDIEKFKRNIFDFKNPNAGTFEKYGKGHAYIADRQLLLAGTNNAEDEFISVEFVCKQVPAVSP